MGMTLNAGGTPQSIASYITTHTIRYLANSSHMSLGSEMDFMKGAIDKDGKFIIDQNIAFQIAQRAPDYRRQRALTKYLLRHSGRKFGPIIAVSYPSWVDDPNHENWVENKATKDSIEWEVIR